MGNSPLTVCIHQVWEKQTVQVVLPDGQVLFMPHPVTVAMLMQAHPGHIVCQGSPSLLEQRLPFDQRLEGGEIYYLLPTPRQVVATTPTRFFQNNNSNNNSFNNNFSASPQHHYQSSRAKPVPQNASTTYKPPPSPSDFDKSPSSPSFSDYARLNLKPQRCLINLFVFRQSVASIMPEESFKPVSQFQGDHHLQYTTKPRAAAASQFQGDPYLQYTTKPRAAASPPPSALLNINSNRYFPQLDQSPKQQPRGAKGRKQGGPWKPNLESISETRQVLHDFTSTFTSSLASLLATTAANTTTTKNYINNFPVPMIAGVKAWAGSPYPSPQSSPLHHSLLTGHSYGGQHYQPQFNQHQQQQRLGNVLHLPLGGDRDSHRQRFIYSA